MWWLELQTPNLELQTSNLELQTPQSGATRQDRGEGKKAEQAAKHLQKIILIWALFTVGGTTVQTSKNTKNLIVCLWLCDCDVQLPCFCHTKLSGCTKDLGWESRESPHIHHRAQHAVMGKPLNSFPENNLPVTPEAQWGQP